jgi:hypothetical protein
MHPMVNTALIALVIPQSKEAEPKFSYVFDYFKQSNNLLHK